MYETVVLPLDEDNFTQTVTPIVQEYFEHGDANEVAVCMRESDISPRVKKLPHLLSC